MHPVDNGFPYGRIFPSHFQRGPDRLDQQQQSGGICEKTDPDGNRFLPHVARQSQRSRGERFWLGIQMADSFCRDHAGRNDNGRAPPLYRTGTINKFPEDRWTSYGAPTPAWPQGKPLWGTVDPEYNECPPDLGANADCNGQPAPYRKCCSSLTWVGQALAARLMGAAGLWNHPAYFDYVDRWVGEPNSWAGGDQDGLGAIYGFGGQFVRDMWKTYRTSIAKPRK